MRNILATFRMWERRPSPLALALAMGMTGAGIWGAWATRELLTLDKRQVVTIELSRIMGDFVEGEARAGHPQEETRTRTEAYLKAVDAAVKDLAQDGRTVLVAEAVVAGPVPDMTDRVRANVARRLEAGGHAAR